MDGGKEPERKGGDWRGDYDMLEMSEYILNIVDWEFKDPEGSCWVKEDALKYHYMRP
jgi:hypothetical protein